MIGGRWRGPSVSDGGAGVPAGPDGVEPVGGAQRRRRIRPARIRSGFIGPLPWSRPYTPTLVGPPDRRGPALFAGHVQPVREWQDEVQTKRKQCGSQNPRSLKAMPTAEILQKLVIPKPLKRRTIREKDGKRKPVLCYFELCTLAFRSVALL